MYYDLLVEALPLLLDLLDLGPLVRGILGRIWAVRVERAPLLTRDLDLAGAAGGDLAWSGSVHGAGRR